MKIDELEKALNKLVLRPLLLDRGQYINDPKKFVNGHLETLKFNSGNKHYMPYYDRLLKYYHLLKNDPENIGNI
jgi:hypothetical protein